MSVTFKTSGLKELDAALAEFKKSTAAGVVRRALVRSLEPMAEVSRQKAPKSPDPQLAPSIKVTTKKPPGHRSKAAFAAAKRAGLSNAEAGAMQRAFNRDNPGAFVEAFVAPDRLAQAWPQEIGTKNHPPHPYMRPGFEIEAEPTIGRLADEMRIEIDKANARARRKALKKPPRL